MEPTSLDTVAFAGLTLHPAKTTLDREEPACLTFICDVSAEQVETLEQVIREKRYGSGDRFFEVTAEGAFSGVRRMRFGQVLWQELPTGRRHMMTLVAFSSDPEPRNSTTSLFGRTDRVIKEAVQTQLTLNNLIRALVDQKIFPADATPPLPEDLEQDPAAIRRRFDRVDDVEDYWA